MPVSDDEDRRIEELQQTAAKALADDGYKILRILITLGVAAACFGLATGEVFKMEEDPDYAWFDGNGSGEFVTFFGSGFVLLFGLCLLWAIPGQWRRPAKKLAEANAALEVAMKAKNAREAHESAEAAKQQQQIKDAVDAAPKKIVSSYERAARAIVRADECATEADRHFARGAFTPFWEAVEGCAKSLNQHRKSLAEVSQGLAEWQRLAASARDIGYRPAVVPPREMAEVATLNPGEKVAARVGALVDEAHTNRDFATIYEQRRTTQAVIDGFNGLNDAVTRLGGVIERSAAGVALAVDASLREVARETRTGSGGGLSMDSYVSPLAFDHTLGGQIRQANASLAKIAAARR